MKRHPGAPENRRRRRAAVRHAGHADPLERARQHHRRRRLARFQQRQRQRTRFADPFGVVLDQQGNLYVADGGDNNSIRKIDLAGVSTTLAGGEEGYAEGAGKAAAFNTPSGLAIDAAGNLYVADTGNNAIRKVTPAGVVSTLAGDGLAGNKDGNGAGAQFNGPIGVAVDADGVVYVADTYNDRIRRIAVHGDVTTIAGGKRAGMADGAAAQALFDTPTGLAISAAGELYIADTGNSAIRKLDKERQRSAPWPPPRKTTATRCCARRWASR
jgi:sugar lactone lactonase YvrE